MKDETTKSTLKKNQKDENEVKTVKIDYIEFKKS
jgi:hypothetical protein